MNFELLVCITMNKHQVDCKITAELEGIACFLHFLVERTGQGLLMGKEKTTNLKFHT